MSGTLFGSRYATRVDYFAFPRTGSHYLSYLMTGLFDLVFFPIPGQNTPEVSSRSEELDPSVLYTLRLREDGVPYQPLYLNHTPLGVHQLPAATGYSILCLIRDPRDTLYSWFRLHIDRFKTPIADPAQWLSEQFEGYQRFYRACNVLNQDVSESMLLVRFEELVSSASMLERICEFVGVKPKLEPEFVHNLMRFDRVVRSDIDRTFYRSGSKNSWRGDPIFESWEAQIPPSHFEEFGY